MFFQSCCILNFVTICLLESYLMKKILQTVERERNCINCHFYGHKCVNIFSDNLDPQFSSYPHGIVNAELTWCSNRISTELQEHTVTFLFKNFYPCLLFLDQLQMHSTVVKKFVYFQNYLESKWKRCSNQKGLQM